MEKDRGEREKVPLVGVITGEEEKFLVGSEDGSLYSVGLGRAMKYAAEKLMRRNFCRGEGECMKRQ